MHSSSSEAAAPEASPRPRPSAEIVMYGGFLLGILVVYAGSVVWAQRRLAQQYRRIDTAIASRVMTAADVPPHTHSHADIVTGRAPAPGVLGVVRSERDDTGHVSAD